MITQEPSTAQALARILDEPVIDAVVLDLDIEMNKYFLSQICSPYSASFFASDYDDGRGFHLMDRRYGERRDLYLRKIRHLNQGAMLQFSLGEFVTEVFAPLHFEIALEQREKNADALAQ